MLNYVTSLISTNNEMLKEIDDDRRSSYPPDKNFDDH